jgi:hypothetical protein
MSVTNVTFGSAQYNSWVAYAAGADMVSNWSISGTIGTGTAPLTGAFPGFSLDGRPVNLYTLTHYWWADASPTTSTIDFEIATSSNGSGGWQSGATNANGASTGVASNYTTARVATVYYGWYKNDSGNIRFNSYASTGNNIYKDGTVDWADRRQYALIVVHTLPSAPGTPVATTINATAISLSWTAPTDVGSSTGVNGYRILKRLSSATTNAAADWEVVAGDTGSTALSATVTNLIPGTSYKFIVAALNSVSDLILADDIANASSPVGSYDSLEAHTGTNSALATGNTLGGVYNGTTWIASPNIMVYNGTAWAKAQIAAYDTVKLWYPYGA